MTDALCVAPSLKQLHFNARVGGVGGTLFDLQGKTGGGAAAEGYGAEWAPMRPSCRGRFERGGSEALDVGGDE